ncbi:MAG: hypothetical protein QOJ67_2521 [Acidimicrobiaceae bacterium]|jgi:hypothetical protein
MAIDISRIPESLVPYYTCGFGESVVLYEGQLELRSGDESESGDGQITLTWRPKPQIRWRVDGTVSPLAAFMAIDRQATQAILPSLDRVPPPGLDVWAPEKRPGANSRRTEPLGPCEFGNPRTLRRMLIHVVNGFEWHLPQVIREGTAGWRGRLTMEVDGWLITVDRHQDPFTELDEEGGFAFTHTLQIERSDGATFAAPDRERLELGMWHFFAFCRGRLVGFTLHVGFDENDEPCWADWSQRLIDDWQPTINWCDLLLVGEFEGLLRSWMTLSEDPFWTQVLHRVVRILVSANDPHPLDAAIPTAQTALELLSWAVLVIKETWLVPGEGDLSFQGRLRLLLKWAGIDPAVPVELVDMERVRREANLTDAPATIAWVRNRLVHPPKMGNDGLPQWPSHDLQVDVWRLSLQYIELIVLRLLGYQGRFGTRTHIDGRWAGDVEPVPWAVEPAGGNG